MCPGWDIGASLGFHLIPWRTLNSKGRATIFLSNWCSQTPMTLTPNTSSWCQSWDRKLPISDLETMLRRGYGLGPVTQSWVPPGTSEQLNLGMGGCTQSPSTQHVVASGKGQDFLALWVISCLFKPTLLRRPTWRGDYGKCLIIPKGVR